MDKIQESALIQSMKKTIEEYDKRFKELNCINERLLDSKKTNKKLKEELNIKRDEYLDFYKKHIKSSSGGINFFYYRSRNVWNSGQVEKLDSLFISFLEKLNESLKKIDDGKIIDYYEEISNKIIFSDEYKIFNEKIEKYEKEIEKLKQDYSVLQFKKSKYILFIVMLCVVIVPIFFEFRGLDFFIK